MAKSYTEQPEFSLKALREVWKNGVRISQIMWRENKSLMIALTVAFAMLAATPFISVGAYGLLIDGVVESSSLGSISTSLIWAFIIYALSQLLPSILMPAEEYFMRLFDSRVNRAMDIELLGASARVDFSLREDPAQMSLFNNAYENWWRPREFMRRQYFMLQNVIEVLIASAIVLLATPPIFLLLLLGTIPELIVESRYGQMVWGIYSAKAEVRRRYWNIRDWFNNKSHLFDMKLFQNAHYFLGTLKNLIDNFLVEERRVEKIKLKKYILAKTFGQLAVIAAYGWLALETVGGSTTIGTLVFIIGAVYNFRTSLSSFFQNLGRQFQDSLFISDLLKLIDMTSSMPRAAEPVKIAENETPEIVFENVTFSYPNGQKPVLKDCSLKIEPGDKVAIIGINGAGKTTFVKLLLRFYDPTEGRILINGRDLKTLDLESWYKMVGVLFQDYANYHLLVKDTIASGRVDKKPELEIIKDSAAAAEADVFIEEWERKYDEQLGSWLGGIEPSVGQWQKIALARTFYRDPRVLILDEPTSSIDAEAEQKIFEKLEALPKDRTVILISHRFSTVRKANKIIVIEDGRIKEEGSHETLMKKKGLYAKLFTMQAKGYK